ncbi:MAG: tetratricopeptide repeat protein [Alphaproteobacteria bacterium]|nr:tetratricopeptide repeat protein [Alphaproteobacteria bacterium]
MADPFLISALRFLEVGDDLRRQGRFGDAESAYRSVLDIDPDNGPAWLGLGLASEGKGDGLAARLAFERATHFMPDRAEAWLGLASACQALNDPFAAVEAWLKARKLKPDDLRIYNVVWQALNEITGQPEGSGYAGAIGRGNAFRSQGQTQVALAAYLEAQKLAPDLPFAYSRAGCLLAKAGDLPGAEAQFAQARELFAWVESGIRLDPGFFQDLPDRPHAFEWVQRAEGEGPLAVIGCDKGYFDRYAANLLASLRRFEGETASLHVHLIHPDEDCLAAARALRVGVSLERPPLGGHSRNFVNTYYASARFLALPGLLESYARPLLVMDVDAVALKPLAPLWEVLTGCDMAIRRLEGSMVDPWNEPQANLVGVSPTSQGLAFARSQASFLAHFVDKKQLFGFFDQTALYSVLAADPRLGGLKKGVFPGHAYGYPQNPGAGHLIYPESLLVGEFKTP